jgi:hypothetical protein
MQAFQIWKPLNNEFIKNQLKRQTIRLLSDYGIAALPDKIMNFLSQKRTDQILSQLNAEEIMSVLEYLLTDSNLSLMQRALNEKSSIDFV